ncbi:hypothetical protein D1872_284020 [compost metagenome]
MAMTEDSTKDAVMIKRRPRASDNVPINNIVMAIATVETESVRLDCAGVMANASLISGMSGWRLYNSANVTNPAANSARLMFRNVLVPC